eukprot:g4084.t1
MDDSEDDVDDVLFDMLDDDDDHTYESNPLHDIVKEKLVPEPTINRTENVNSRPNASTFASKPNPNSRDIQKHDRNDSNIAVKKNLLPRKCPILQTEILPPLARKASEDSRKKHSLPSAGTLASRILKLHNQENEQKLFPHQRRIHTLSTLSFLGAQSRKNLSEGQLGEWYLFSIIIKPPATRLTKDHRSYLSLTIGDLRGAKERYMNIFTGAATSIDARLGHAMIFVNPVLHEKDNPTRDFSLSLARGCPAFLYAKIKHFARCAGVQRISGKPCLNVVDKSFHVCCPFHQKNHDGRNVQVSSSSSSVASFSKAKEMMQLQQKLIKENREKIVMKRKGVKGQLNLSNVLQAKKNGRYANILNKAASSTTSKATAKQNDNAKAQRKRKKLGNQQIFINKHTMKAKAKAQEMSTQPQLQQRRDSNQNFSRISQSLSGRSLPQNTQQRSHVVAKAKYVNPYKRQKQVGSTTTKQNPKTYHSLIRANLQHKDGNKQISPAKRYLQDRTKQNQVKVKRNIMIRNTSSNPLNTTVNQSQNKFQMKTNTPVSGTAGGRKNTNNVGAYFKSTAKGGYNGGLRMKGGSRMSSSFGNSSSSILSNLVARQSSLSSAMSSSSNAAKLAQLRAQRIQKKQHEAKLQRRREGKIGIVAERKRKEEELAKELEGHRKNMNINALVSEEESRAISASLYNSRMANIDRKLATAACTERVQEALEKIKETRCQVVFCHQCQYIKECGTSMSSKDQRNTGNGNQSLKYCREHKHRMSKHWVLKKYFKCSQCRYKMTTLSKIKSSSPNSHSHNQQKNKSSYNALGSKRARQYVSSKNLNAKINSPIGHLLNRNPNGNRPLISCPSCGGKLWEPSHKGREVELIKSRGQGLSHKGGKEIKSLRW